MQRAPSLTSLASSSMPSKDSFGRLHEREKEVPKATKLLTKLFPNKVTIHMPQDEGLLVSWKQQLDRDAETLKMKGNLNHLRTVLGRCGMECEGLDTLSIKDQTLTNESSKKVVGWALSHHLMENPKADPETRVVLSVETYNAVRGYGLGVELVDVPGIQTAKLAVSCDVASLQFELEASLAENTRLTKEATKKDEQLQAVQTELNSIETRIGNPLHSIISAGPDTIKKLIAALSDIAEKQPQSIQEMQSTPMEGYVTLLRH